MVHRHNVYDLLGVGDDETAEEAEGGALAAAIARAEANLQASQSQHTAAPAPMPFPGDQGIVMSPDPSRSSGPSTTALIAGGLAAFAAVYFLTK